MLTKITGVARVLGILLAIVAGIVPIPGVNIAFALIVLGLIAGITATREQLPNLLIGAFALPAVGVALTNVPTIGTQAGAIFTNLGINVAGAAAMAAAIAIYNIVLGDIKGLGSTKAS